MSPCPNSYSSVHQLRMSERDNIKLRKPIVEKMRRDRINTCIEQLKVILEKEFHKQEPNSKLEKADILEMTVSFLKQQLQSGFCQGDFSQSYPHCLRDSVHLLSVGSATKASAGPQPILQHQDSTAHQTQRASSCFPLRPSTQLDSSSSRGSVWRPW
ncbi:hairy-related 12 [Cyprinodon tularosa]|uniref:hairy-related 12 n=1 Tax=Cyprinodon tularosa TaxID=77115 RepID=UPI0018E264DF|nr:hairy-related 12 [Cyprinodon tularosa]